uniref:Uncharacterized protein n=1 Tax=Sphaerodactylus townsendi TaxID=933632 RepID=A0ACB8EM81_9SAUR
MGSAPATFRIGKLNQSTRLQSMDWDPQRVCGHTGKWSNRPICAEGEPGGLRTGQRERKRRHRDGDRRGDSPVRRAEFGDNLPSGSLGIESFRSGGSVGAWSSMSGWAIWWIGLALLEEEAGAGGRPLGLGWRAKARKGSGVRAARELGHVSAHLGNTGCKSDRRFSGIAILIFGIFFRRGMHLA